MVAGVRRHPARRPVRRRGGGHLPTGPVVRPPADVAELVGLGDLLVEGVVAGGHGRVYRARRGPVTFGRHRRPGRLHLPAQLVVGVRAGVRRRVRAGGVAARVGGRPQQPTLVEPEGGDPGGGAGGDRLPDRRCRCRRRRSRPVPGWSASPRARWTPCRTGWCG